MFKTTASNATITARATDSAAKTGSLQIRETESQTAKKMRLQKRPTNDKSILCAKVIEMGKL
ncbi:hypothetical protein HGB07_07495 [Candidatus Roizmanbacteria bacterium]|nr:hypothetical protein [Candidatus Roizmanbacteria bacterium]